MLSSRAKSHSQPVNLRGAMHSLMKPHGYQILVSWSWSDLWDCWLLTSDWWILNEYIPHACLGADPGFFLGGDALVSCSTSTPINHIFFVFCRIPVVVENHRSSQGRGGVHPLHPPPRSAPDANVIQANTFKLKSSIIIRQVLLPYWYVIDICVTG